MITSIGTEKTHRDYHEKILLYLSICINCGYECILRIERNHLLIFTDCMGDIRSFYFTFAFDICWMDDIHDLDSFSTMFLDDAFRVFCSIWCTSLGCEEDNDIFFEWVVRRLDGENILFDHIIWLGIDRYDDDMLDILGSFFDDSIFGPIGSFYFEELEIRSEYIVV